MLKRALVIGACFAIATTTSACSSKQAADECSPDIPTSCVDASLSYDSGVGAKLTVSCSPCHAAGGVAASVRLTDYANVSSRLPGVADQLASCAMPPAGEPPLSAADRQVLIDWIVCGAPR